MRLERVPPELRQLHPNIFADQIFTPALEQSFGLPINESELPVPIHREKSVTGLLEDVGHFPNRFLQFRAGMEPLRQSANPPLSNGKANVQPVGIQRLSQ